MGAELFLQQQRTQMILLATRHAIPTMFAETVSAGAGGLFSYGPDLLDLFRQVGNYAGRILRNEKPADLPVAQPTKFELVINLKATDALGLTIPETLLATVDEVIQ
jgi:putative tryptophan/tyrosine transport system substrate-binding protein